jgi:hypothetical protein
MGLRQCIWCDYAHENCSYWEARAEGLLRSTYIAAERIGEYIAKVELLERENKQLEHALYVLAETHKNH